MYILKNALRCVCRSKGRSVLIGVIVLAISVAACIGLSIRQASDNAREEALESLSVRATISFDRQSMMNELMEEGAAAQSGQFDQSQFAQMMGESSELAA